MDILVARESFSKRDKRAIIKFQVLLGRSDRQGILFDQAVPAGQTVNGDCYRSVLRKVLHATRTKRPALHEAGVILLQDNAAPHRKQNVLAAIESWGWEILPHPPYSPDLSPCDFFLFPRIKESMRGRRFGTEDEVNQAYKAGMDAVTKVRVGAGIDGLVRRWEKCVEAEGGYFE